MTAPADRFRIPDDDAPLSPEERVVDQLLSEEVPAQEETGPIPGLTPRARRRLATQQAIHGLLRSLYMDAAAREARVAIILARVREEAARQPAHARSLAAAGDAAVPPPAGFAMRRAWRDGRVWRGLAAAALILVVGTWALFQFASPDPYREALAAVDRVVQSLEASEGREYEASFTRRLLVDGTSVPAGHDVTIEGRDFRFFVGGKGRYLLSVVLPRALGQPLKLSLDRDRVFVKLPPESEPRELKLRGPLVLPRGLSLDVDLLRIDSVLRLLPERFDIKSWGRVRAPGGQDEGLIQLEAVRRPSFERGLVARIHLTAEEVSGRLRELDFEVEGAPGPGGGPAHMRAEFKLRFLRTVEMPDAFWECR